MNKQDLLKLQTCVLKVNIHCDGCEHKVKKLLQKIDGVYSVNIDAEQGKVVVTGNVDPATLLKKLKSSGKRAELWGPKGMMFPTNQFKNLQLDHHVHGKGGKDNKSHKGGKDHQKGGGQPQLFQFQNKGPNNFNLPAKDHKSVKFNMPGEEFDASDDEFDDYGDSEDDYEEDHVHTHAMPNKMMSGHKGNSGGGGKNAKKIDVMDLAEQIKAKNAGNGGKKGHEGGGQKHNHGGGGNKKNTKTSGGLLGRFLGFGKKGGDKSKDKKKEGGGGGGTGNNKKGKEGKKKKKGGDKFEDEGYDFDDDEHDLDEFDIPQSHQGKSKGKGGNGGKNNSGKGNSNNGNVGQMGPIQMGQMEQMRNLMQMQGLPAMNGGGYYPGMQMQHHAPPQYQPQQPYMAPMMSHNYQQQPHMNSMYPPPTMMYGRPYMPPPPPIPVYPGTDPVAHAFNDENTEACTVM
ncbi:hypothetical protein K1719_033232 [Acacia pycnantha]|nr:hypothetical protein K1719_033232 [Acacia pycnantha]